MAFESGSLNLFLYSEPYRPESGNLPLYTQGATSGTEHFFNNLDLYIEGDPFNESINLFLSGYSDPGNLSESINLFIQGQGTHLNNDLNLILSGTDGLYLDLLTLEQLALLTLEELSNLPLSNGIRVANNVPLFISADGTNAGWIPNNTYLNLYINTGQASNSSVDLFVDGIGEISNNINMYSFGVIDTVESGINLYLHSIDTNIKPLELFIRGYVPR